MDQEILEIFASGDKEKLSEILVETELDELTKVVSPVDGRTGPEIAACCGCLEIIEELVNNGFQANTSFTKGYTLLHWCASWGNLEIVKYLVNKGVDIFALNGHGESARHMAAKFGKDECELYLEKSELLEELKLLALSYKDIIADPEKNMGKFNKEDRVLGNRNCDEKIDWIESNRDVTNRQQINDQIEELKKQLQNTMSKLEDIPIQT